MADQTLNPAPQVARHLEGLALLLNPLIAQTDEVEKLRREVELWKTEWSRIDKEKRALEAKPKSVGPPFTAVLIDGDGLIFQEQLIQKGYQGGQLAAQTLLSALPKLAATGAGAEVIVESRGYIITGDTENGLVQEPKEVDSVIVNVFINKLGLGNALIKAGLVKCYADYDKFWQGFSAAHELFIVCDVGQGKEASDAKIREYLRLYAKNAQCEMIVLGASHDNGYATVLSSLQTESRLSKLLLLKGYSDLAYQLKQYSSRVVSIPQLFRTEKIPNVPMSFAAATATVSSKKPDGSVVPLTKPKTYSKAALDPHPQVIRKDATNVIVTETIATTKPSKFVQEAELVPVTTKKKSIKTVALNSDLISQSDIPPAFSFSNIKSAQSSLDSEIIPVIKTKKKKVANTPNTDDTSGVMAKQLDAPPTPYTNNEDPTKSNAEPGSVSVIKKKKVANTAIKDYSSDIDAKQTPLLNRSTRYSDTESIPVIKKKKAVKGSTPEIMVDKQPDVQQVPMPKTNKTSSKSAVESDPVPVKNKKKSNKTIFTDTAMSSSIIFKQPDAPKPLISSKSITQSTPGIAPIVATKTLTPDSDTLFETNTHSSYETETDSLDSFDGEVYQWGSIEPTSRARKSEREKEKPAKVVKNNEEEDDGWVETPTKKKKDKKDKTPQIQTKMQTKAADLIRKLDPRPCHAHYLSKKCKVGSKCTYGHDYDLNNAELEELARLAKSNPCPQAWNNKCRLSSDECILGHKCLLGPNCSFGDFCRFSNMPGAHE